VPIGTRVCSESPGDAAMPDPSVPVDVPWTTGFEDGFCAYARPQGFCFASGSGSYAVDTAPVHSGQRAAAFTVGGDAATTGFQARCVRQGVFPNAAYYSAWYYVPMLADNSGTWNLLHFQGGTPGQTLHGLWDVSLVNLSDGSLHVVLFDFLAGSVPDSSAVPPIPIGQWFQIEVYFKRAKDSTGTLSLFQDGSLAATLTDLVTDDSDWGQWYVGNLADSLQPAVSTVYVDDVAIRSDP